VTVTRDAGAGLDQKNGLGDPIAGAHHLVVVLCSHHELAIFFGASILNNFHE
jgi:hypothetical protein